MLSSTQLRFDLLAVPYSRQTQKTRWSPNFEGSQEQRYELYKDELRNRLKALMLKDPGRFAHLPYFEPLDLRITVEGSTRSDLSNLVKGVEDAFNCLRRGGKGRRSYTPFLWDDDSLIERFQGTRYPGDTSVQLEVKPLWGRHGLFFHEVTGTSTILATNLITLWVGNENGDGHSFNIRIPKWSRDVVLSQYPTRLFLYCGNRVQTNNLVGFLGFEELLRFRKTVSKKGKGMTAALKEADAGPPVSDFAVHPSVLDESLRPSYTWCIYTYSSQYNFSPERSREDIYKCFDHHPLIDWSQPREKIYETLVLLRRELNLK